MKNYLILTSLLISNWSYAQFVGLKYISIEPANLVAIYKLQYRPDSTDITNIRSSTMLLFLGPNISKFVNRAKFMNDTAVRKFTTSDQVINYLSDPKVSHSAFQYQIFKNYPKGKLTNTDHIPSDTYRYEEPLDLFNWQITGDTSTVCGYKVQKAICDFGGRSWIAWFTPDLPYSDGPYKFNGLPGIIIKVYDTHNHYVFEMTGISKLQPSVMMDIEDKDYIVTTKQGFFKAWDSFRADIVNRAKQFGGDNDMQQTLAKNLAKNNNPIELARK